jgi:hypothetical protein
MATTFEEFQEILQVEIFDLSKLQALSLLGIPSQVLSLQATD